MMTRIMTRNQPASYRQIDSQQPDECLLNRLPKLQIAVLLVLFAGYVWATAERAPEGLHQANESCNEAAAMLLPNRGQYLPELAVRP